MGRFWKVICQVFEEIILPTVGVKREDLEWSMKSDCKAKLISASESKNRLPTDMCNRSCVQTVYSAVTYVYRLSTVL